jgi:hypothetical protein
MTKDELDTILTSWHTVNKALSGMTEQDIKDAIQRELVGNRRKDVVIRLHQRMSILRAAREREELVAAVTDVPAFLVGVV